MDEIGRLLPTILKASNQNEDVTERACFIAWDVVVGKANQLVSAPMRLNNKTLVVATLDRQWQKQLETLAGQILFRLNATLGAPLVTRIHLCTDPKWVTQHRAACQKSDSPPLPPPESDLVEAANGIQDPELRDQFLRTAGRCLFSSLPSSSTK